MAFTRDEIDLVRHFRQIGSEEVRGSISSMLPGASASLTSAPRSGCAQRGDGRSRRRKSTQVGVRVVPTIRPWRYSRTRASLSRSGGYRMSVRVIATTVALVALLGVAAAPGARGAGGRPRHLRYRLEGRGRAWRVLSGDRHRPLSPARHRGDAAPGRPAGQSGAASGGRAHRVQHRVEFVHPTQFRQAVDPDAARLPFSRRDPAWSWIAHQVSAIQLPKRAQGVKVDHGRRRHADQWPFPA